MFFRPEGLAEFLGTFASGPGHKDVARRALMIRRNRSQGMLFLAIIAGRAEATSRLASRYYQPW
jgi:hypothetical protein